MRIAVYTLTRDRLDYTKIAFASLKENAGHAFDHYVLDNGSEDQTPQWLEEEYNPHWLDLAPMNMGISNGSNTALDHIFDTRGDRLPGLDYDLIIKMDNDCLVLTPDILRQFADIYGDPEAHRWVLAPRVEGLNRQPRRITKRTIGNHPIGVTAIVGGLFHVVPAAIYRQYRYPDNLPLARGQDDHFCDWLRHNGYERGYVEDLAVQHYETTDGQAQRYPQYFERKWREERMYLSDLQRSAQAAEQGVQS